MARVWTIALIAAAAFVAYHRTFSVPLLLDDHHNIAGNPTIRRLWPPPGPLSPPAGDGITVGGRPLLNLSFALDYAVSGTEVWSYHAVNLAIHVLTGVVLFAVVRRMLVLSRPGAGAGDPLLPALAVALLWTLHPLQTESVTYVTQRAESLVGLLYLLTLYGFIRATAAAEPRLWYALTIAACLLGMASKEVMVSAPLVVALYDRTFIAGSLREAWRLRRGLYVGLFATWLPLAYLVAGTAGRGGTAGWSTEVPWWAYALTQCRAIVHYLRLSLWPSPLVFDYGLAVVRDPYEVVAEAALLLLLLALAAVALRRWPRIGFLAAFFFALLAPSSSVIPIATQTMAEHRMYLPLAAILTLIVVGLHACFGARAVWACFLWAAVLGWLTFDRNQDYRSELSLWEDTVAKAPSNARAHSNLGKALLDAQRTEAAFAHLAESVRLGPPLPAAHYNLGLILDRQGRKAEARRHYEAAVRINPRYAEAHVNLGVALLETGAVAGALPHLQTAVALAPDLAAAHCTLADALTMSGRLEEAAQRYAEALRLAPDYAVAHANYGSLLLRTQRPSEAERHYRRAIEIEPDYVWAHHNLGIVLLEMRRGAEAAASFERALQLQPDFAPAREMLSRLRAGGAG
jgi:tetratricopeptide (TPR) repeat protein